MLLKAQDACWQQLRELRLINENVKSFVDKEMSLELLGPSWSIQAIETFLIFNNDFLS